MELRRRTLLRVVAGIGGVWLSGCTTGHRDRPEGLARVEFYNYDTTGHVVEAKLSNQSGTVLADRTMNLAPATAQSADEATPIPTTEWVSDFPEQTGTFQLQWSVDSGQQETFQTENIQGCELLRAEIDSAGQMTVRTHGTVDCYGE